MAPKSDFLVPFQVVVTHKRFVVPGIALANLKKLPDASHQKCAFLLACSDFLTVQIISTVEEIAVLNLMT